MAQSLSHAAFKPLTVKAILLGAVSVGKTSLCHFLVTNTPLDMTNPTIGCAHFTLSIPYNSTDQYRFNLNINDTSGSERYASLLPVYYRGSQLAIVVADVKDEDSIYEVPIWLDRLDAANNSEEIQCIPIFVLNKCDLADDDTITRKESLLRELISTHCNDPIIIKTCSLNGVGVYCSPNDSAVGDATSSSLQPIQFTALIPAIHSILTVLAQNNSLTAQQKNMGIGGTKLSENHVDLDAKQNKGGCC